MKPETCSICQLHLVQVKDKLECFNGHVFTLEGVQIKDKPETLIDAWHFFTLEDSQEMLYYKGGVYHENAEALIMEALEREDPKITDEKVHDITGHILRRTLRPRMELDANLSIFNLKNGLLDVETLTFGPHTWDYPSLVQLPVEYKPEAKGELWLKFLSEVLRPEDVQVVQEMAGYLLHRGYPAQKAFFFVGSGSNGKSTFISALKAFLGPDNVAGYSLQDFESDKFSKAGLYGKLANLCTDVSYRGLRDVGVFKAATGGDLITARRLYSKAFNYVNHAKLIYSMNLMPEIFEETDAFFRRVLIVNFPNVFEGDKVDADLLAKLTIPEELSGVLNWALEGLKRLESNGWRFSYSKSTEDTLKDYIHKSSPVLAFLEDRAVSDPQSVITKPELYKAFVLYCKETNLPAVSEAPFFLKLRMHRPELIEGRHTEGDKRTRTLQGLRLIAESTL